MHCQCRQDRTSGATSAILLNDINSHGISGEYAINASQALSSSSFPMPDATDASRQYMLDASVPKYKTSTRLTAKRIKSGDHRRMHIANRL